MVQGSPAPPSSTPLSRGSKAGAESFAASSISRYCDAANFSRVGPSTLDTAGRTDAVTRFTSEGFWFPIRSSGWFSGAKRWLIWSVPTGCIARTPGLSRFRKLTNNRPEAGKVARQLSGLANSARILASASIGASSSAKVSPKVTLTSTSNEKKRRLISADPRIRQGRSPSSVPLRRTPHTPTPNTLTEKPAEMSTMK